MTFVDGLFQLLIVLVLIYGAGYRKKSWWFEDNNINNPITAMAIEAEWWLDRMGQRRVS